MTSAAADLLARSSAPGVASGLDAIDSANASAVSSSWREFPASVFSTRTSRGSHSGARSGSGVRARWTGEHRGDVLEQLESAVERSAGNHLEGDIGIPVVDAVAAGAPRDHGEDDHA